MKKIAIVNNGKLPLPAVKGGAVECLIDLLLNENEKYGNVRFEVFSIYDKDAAEASKKYKYASFVYVNEKSFSSKIKYLFMRIVNFVAFRAGGYYRCLSLHREMSRKIMQHRNDYAAILLEGASINTYYFKHKTNLPVIARYHNLPTRKLRQFDTFNAQATDLYLGISEFVCNQLRQVEGKWCPNIERLYNSVEFNKFQKELNDGELLGMRHKLGIEADDFVVMFSGRMREFKGIKQLLEAMLLCRDKRNIKLLAVGSSFFSSDQKTAFEKSLEPIIDQLGEKVIFTGYVQYGEMYKYYKLADVCAFPSIWEEPFALTCLEALVCGKPVIITESGGMVEVVDDECAIIVPNDADLPAHLSKAIKQLYADRGRIKSMAIAAKKRAEHFSPDNHYKRFCEIINQNFDIKA